MRFRWAILAAAANCVAAACHDSTGILPDPQRLRAVNGSTFPVLATGDTVVLEGSGFGAAQGNGRVTFDGSSGTSATVVSWTDNQIVALVPVQAQSGSITVAPDTGSALAPVPTLIRSAAAFSPSSFNWNPGPALPEGLRAVQLTGLTYPSDTGLTARLHATDGTTSLFAVAGATGPIAWQPGLDPAPTEILYAGAASATQARARLRRHPNRDSTVEGVSYLIGGIDASGRVVADVYGMSVWENGDEGAWTRLVALPDPRAAAASTVAYGNLYVVGGFGPDSIALRAASVAVVDSFGAVSGWLEGPPLPEGRAFAAAVVRNHILFVLGGEAGHVSPSTPDTTDIRADVFAIRLSPITGFFLDSGWQTLTTPLLAPRSRHAAFDVDAGILVSVGLTPPGAAESEFAAWAPDGLLGSFAALAAPTIASLGSGPISEAGAASYVDRSGVPHVVIVGGVTASGGLSDRVWWH